MLFSVLVISLSFLLPIILGSALREPDPVPKLPEAAVSPEAAPSPKPEDFEPVYDADMPLAVLANGEIHNISMDEYLLLALAGEMPASFEPEALKAQAVALRTYTLYFLQSRKQNHPDADICDDFACCAAAESMDSLREKWGENFEACYEKLRRAIRETDGQHLRYGGETALTVFHSSSEGRTEQSGSIWADLPYLQSVPSPETEQSVSSLRSVVEVSAEDFRQTVLAVCPEAVFGEDPSAWVGEREETGGGRVAAITLGGQSVSGMAVRSMFSLRSADFKLGYIDGAFIFEVSGYGHGVGMSQYGANTFAAEGMSYDEILSHYYPGCELVMSVVARQ